MHLLRTSTSLARLVLAWFVLTLGVAMASPMVSPQSMQVVCSAGGAVKVVFTDENGAAQDPAQSMLHCSLCLATALPPPSATQWVPTALPLGHVLQPIVAAQHAARLGAPLPARGPPGFSLS